MTILPFLNIYKLKLYRNFPCVIITTEPPSSGRKTLQCRGVEPLQPLPKSFFDLKPRALLFFQYKLQVLCGGPMRLFVIRPLDFSYVTDTISLIMQNPHRFLLFEKRKWSTSTAQISLLWLHLKAILHIIFFLCHNSFNTWHLQTIPYLNSKYSFTTMEKSASFWWYYIILIKEL